ncbi:hypothetical protein GWI33_019006 [Rhynchophorus ferrugineus]|uniref:Uncharacterized protein n=1 Tax=Rhynchophorus ferrugineus TaxID=354439 RepID=A0A834HV82_RHYFE|nr:hypothetical protein GWI33_019006 [Rhynchophorus ferrugineus]
MLFQTSISGDARRTSTDRPIDVGGKCATATADAKVQQQPQQQQECSRALHILDSAPAPGWTVHVTPEGRLFYCK